MHSLLLFLTLFAAQTSRPASQPTTPKRGPAPAIVEDLKAPSLKRTGPEDPPEDGRLLRNSGVAGRFTEEGTNVDYAFESRAGEVSLFQLVSWGYSRGWQSTARIRVLDEAGLELATHTRAGGSRYEVFLAFEAPYEGVFHCELEASHKFYRYTLVRHSDFPAHYGQRIELGEADQSYAFLSDPAARVTFSVQLEANQEVSLRALNADPRARKNISSVRKTAILDGDSAPQSRTMMAEGPDPDPIRDWPMLNLRVLGESSSAGAKSHHASFTPKESGVYFVEVACQSRGEGGIIELLVDRNIQRSRVHGRIADKHGRPRSAVELNFYSEPDFEFIGSAITNGSGDYELSVPSGPYTVTLRNPGRALVSLRTNVFGPRELNAIYSKNAPVRPTSQPTMRE